MAGIAPTPRRVHAGMSGDAQSGGVVSLQRRGKTGDGHVAGGGASLSCLVDHVDDDFGPPCGLVAKNPAEPMRTRARKHAVRVTDIDARAQAVVKAADFGVCP